MAKFRLAATAEDQIANILIRSEEKFGELSRERYAVLLVTAMQDVATDPFRQSVSWKRISSGKVGIYHIAHSRKHVPDPPGVVTEPSHLLVFRIAADHVIDILGVLHESMLLDRAIRRLVLMNKRSD
jgi:toxin ParE1/3/4